jgi:hypothetical protein
MTTKVRAGDWSLLHVEHVSSYVEGERGFPYQLDFGSTKLEVVNPLYESTH